MKKLSAYLLLLSLLIISVAACSKTEDPATVTKADPHIPVQVRADAGDKQITLDWQMVGSAATYNIYCIADPGNTYNPNNKPSTATMKAGTKITQVGGENIVSAPITITGLNNGITYWFAISCVDDSANESDLSNPINAVPISPARPLAPENVRANAGNASVTVTWTPVAGVDHYLLYCYWNEGLSAIGEGTITIPGGASHLQIVDSTTINWIIGEDAGVTPNPGLKNGRTYYFWLFAINGGGVSSGSSFFASAVPNTAYPPTAPVVTDVTAGNKEITVTWNKVTASPDVASYNIYIGTAKGVLKSTGQVSPYTPTLGDDGPYAVSSGAVLTNGTTYYIVVTAVNANGESAESDEWYATPASGGGPSGIITEISGSIIIYAH